MIILVPLIAFSPKKLPPTWPDLFENSSENYLDPDLRIQHALHPSWTESTSHSCPTVCFVDELDRIPMFPMDDTSSLPDPADEIDTSPSHSPTSVPLTHSAWNQHHPYSTWFKRKIFSANVAVLETALSDDTLPFDNSAALNHSNVSSNTDGTHNNIPHYAFVAANDDTLHYGQMRKAPDRAKFEQDMHVIGSNLIIILAIRSSCETCQKE
jgi:hypothetical protein